MFCHPLLQFLHLYVHQRIRLDHWRALTLRKSYLMWRSGSRIFFLTVKRVFNWFVAGVQITQRHLFFHSVNHEFIAQSLGWKRFFALLCVCVCVYACDEGGVQSWRWDVVTDFDLSLCWYGISLLNMHRPPPLLPSSPTELTSKLMRNGWKVQNCSKWK